MSSPPAVPRRTPPKFVPTLTERVDPGKPLAQNVPVQDAPVVERPSAIRAEETTPELASGWLGFLNEREANQPVEWPGSNAGLASAPVASRRAVDMRIAGLPLIAPDLALQSESEAMASATGWGTEHVSQPMSAEQATDFEEMLVHRVLQRVDIALDQRLRTAVAAVVEEHSRSLLPKLREEVKGVVSRVVNEAVADELSSLSKIGTV